MKQFHFRRILVLLAPLLAVVMAGPVRADELTLHLDAMGPENPSPFKTQLRVTVTNESFTSFPLVDKIKGSELLIDGRPFTRQPSVPFDGPAGLSPKGSWEGCMNAEDYVPPGGAAGDHRLKWRLAGKLSNEVRIKSSQPMLDATTPEGRLKQVKALQGALKPGVLRSCVENWLTDKDGGLAGIGTVRYYVRPGVKVKIHYDGPEQRISGPVEIYPEGRVAD